MKFNTAGRYSPANWVFVACCLLIVFALNLPVFLQAARQKFVISHGYWNANAWNRSLWAVNGSELFAAVCLPVAFLGALISGLKMSRRNAVPAPLLLLGFGLLVGPFWIEALIKLLAIWSPGFGRFEDAVFYLFFGSLFLIPASIISFITVFVRLVRK